jgi:hypothetical protein
MFPLKMENWNKQNCMFESMDALKEINNKTHEAELKTVYLEDKL